MLFIGDSQAKRAACYQPRPTIWAFKGRRSIDISSNVRRNNFRNFSSIFLLVGSVDCLQGLSPHMCCQALEEIHAAIRAQNKDTSIIVCGLPQMCNQQANPITVALFNKAIKKCSLKLHCNKTMFFSTAAIKLQRGEFWKKIHFDRDSLCKAIDSALKAFDKYHK
jgi:hypothetical protein